MIAFILSHWRLTLALLLAGALYAEDSSRRLADAQRDAAVAQASLWKHAVDEQNSAIQALHAASDARDKKSQQAVNDAISQARADDETLKRILAAEPKPGDDRCKAAQALIWQVIGGGGASTAH